MGLPESGPSIIIIAGMHGNEPAGIYASEYVFDFIRKNGLKVNGFVTALKGNLPAIQKNVRFVDKDLNRLWTDEYLQSDDDSVREIAELKSLHTELNRLCQQTNGDCLLLDLHTFSAKSGIFAMPSGQTHARKIAGDLGVPFVNRLAQVLPNTAVNYYGSKGIDTLAFEAGNHEAHESVDNMISALFVTLVSAGCLDEGNIPGIENHRNRLKQTANGLPQKMELVYRFTLEDASQFKMNPGYTNFQKITKGEHLANLNGEKVLAPLDGYMLMPLYQKIGSDGFFIVK